MWYQSFQNTPSDHSCARTTASVGSLTSAIFIVAGIMSINFGVSVMYVTWGKRTVLQLRAMLPLISRYFIVTPHAEGGAPTPPRLVELMKSIYPNDPTVCGTKP